VALGPRFRMAEFVMVRVALMAVILFCALPVEAMAQSWGGLYNMDSLLRESHPFAQRRQPAPPTAYPVNAPARPATGLPPTSRPPQQPAPAAPIMANDDGEWKYSDMFSEIRGGVLMHDTGPFSASDESGFDANVELLFTAPELFDFMWSPRPHLGISYNSSGDTSQAYTGLTWEWSFWNGWFAGFSFGGMVHDGHLVGIDGEQKSLGCRFLFRESINAGYRFNKRHALMVHLDHSSNASLCKKNTADGTAEGRHDVVLNEGLENVGIRYGYMF